jgi:hypothetical protein
VKKFTKKTVSTSDLYLDPNNPRLAQDFASSKLFVDDDIEGEQPRLDSMFGMPFSGENEQDALDITLGEVDDDPFFHIDTLKSSIRDKGFVQIETVVVREIGSSGKYVVIDGNRRLASIRSVLREHGQAESANDKAYISNKSIRASLRNIEVTILEPNKGADDDTLESTISTTLGLRHYQGHLGWELLPRAKNIFDEYTQISNSPFSYQTKFGQSVAKAMAIRPAEVKRLLRGYCCYTQLAKLYQLQPHHFSLILGCVCNTNLASYGYIRIDETTFVLEGDSPTKVDNLCQFEDRDRKDFKKIIQDPKEFTRLGRMFKEQFANPRHSVKEQAKTLFLEVLDSIKTLEEAHTELTHFKRREEWLEELVKLLKRQSHDVNLTPEKFVGAGAELESQTDLRKTLNRFLLIIESEA